MGHGRNGVTWQAPGRVNLIGEHTDYNAGFVLPFAIEQACTATVERIDECTLAISSTQRAETPHFALDGLEPGAADGWAGYAAGVVWALLRLGADVPGLRIALDSTVPPGAGLSSSAALTCAVATAVDDLLGLRLSAGELLSVTRSAENDFVGAPTGGMDQLAALNCTAGNVLFCDMRTLETEQVPLPLAASGLTILVVDTHAAHRHADGEYQLRRAGCERAAHLLGLTSLRELTVADLDPALDRLPSDDLRRYTRHVVTENERVLRTVDLLRDAALAETGPLLTASHESLRDDYRVSITELDAAVATLLAHGALGARMTGGGFGGSIIALIAEERCDAAVKAVTITFRQHGFVAPSAFTARPSRGAHRVG